MLLKRGDVETVGVIDRAVVFDDADDFESDGAHELGRHAAHVAEALNHHPRILRLEAEQFERLQDDDHAAAPGGLRTAARTA